MFDNNTTLMVWAILFLAVCLVMLGHHTNQCVTSAWHSAIKHGPNRPQMSYLTLDSALQGAFGWQHFSSLSTWAAVRHQLVKPPSTMKCKCSQFCVIFTTLVLPIYSPSREIFCSVNLLAVSKVPIRTLTSAS